MFRRNGCVMIINSNQLKVRMHQIIWQQEVQNVIKVSHEKSVVRRLEKLLTA